MATLAEMQAQADALGVSLESIKSAYGESQAFEAFSGPGSMQTGLYLGEVRTLIASAAVRSVSEIQDSVALINASNQFRAEEKGELEIKFLYIPFDSSLGGWADGILKAAGVRLWKNTLVENNTIRVYFVTGIAPLMVAAIIVGAFVGLTIYVYYTIQAISIYKVTQDQQAVYGGTEKENQDAFMSALKGLTPEEQIKAIQNRTTTVAETAGSNAASDITKPLGQALVVIIVIIGLVLIVPLLVRR